MTVRSVGRPVLPAVVFIRGVPGVPARLDDSHAPEWEQRMVLADHECQHGRLPTDGTPACGCWPEAV